MSYDQDPLPILLWCPECRARHVDEGEFATKPHHTHSCQSCGMTWRPAVVLTVGVQFLPGFKNRPKIENIEAKVKEIICQQLAVSPEKIRPEASFVDDLKADSLAAVELVLALEETFDMEFPDEDIEQIKTVGDAINYIKKRKSV